jgi:hypothetical protein
MRSNPSEANSNFSVNCQLPDGAVLFHNSSTSILNFTIQYPQTDFDNYNYLKAFLRQNMIFSRPLISIINLLDSAKRNYFILFFF